MTPQPKIKVKSKVHDKRRDIVTVLLTEYVDNLKLRFEDSTEIKLSQKQQFELLAGLMADLSYQLKILFDEGWIEPEPSKELVFLDDEKPDELGNSRQISKSVRQKRAYWSPLWVQFCEHLVSVFTHLETLEAIEPPRICNAWEYCAANWGDREFLITQQRANHVLHQELTSLQRRVDFLKRQSHHRQKVIRQKVKILRDYEKLLRQFPFLQGNFGQMGKPTTIEEYIRIENLRHSISRAVSEERQHQSQHEIATKIKLPTVNRHLKYDGTPVDNYFDDSFSAINTHDDEIPTEASLRRNLRKDRLIHRR